MIGRDPKGSRIEQRKTLSLGISPALTHYISNKGVYTTQSRSAFIKRWYIVLRDTRNNVYIFKGKPYSKLVKFF